MKEDRQPLVWGEFTIAEIQQVAKAQKDHKQAEPTKVDNATLLKKLEELEDFYQAYRDEMLQTRILTALPRMKEAF